MTLTLQTRDGELIEQWDIADYGNLARAISQRAFMAAILAQLDRASALEKFRGLTRGRNHGQD